MRKKPTMIVLAILLPIWIVLLFRSFYSPRVQAIDSEEYCRSMIGQTYSQSEAEAYTQENADTWISFDQSFFLYDFDGKPNAVYYQLKPVGFSVYNIRKGTIVEANTEIDHPYLSVLEPDGQYYFDGSDGYYKRDGGVFTPLVVGQTISAGKLSPAKKAAIAVGAAMLLVIFAAVIRAKRGKR